MKVRSHYLVILHTPDVEVRKIKYLRNVRKLIKKEGERVKGVTRITQNQRFHCSERVYRSTPDCPLNNIKAKY